VDEDTARAEHLRVFLVEVWIEKVLLSETRHSVLLSEVVMDMGLLPAKSECSGWPLDQLHCHGTSPEEIALFIMTGVKAIPKLMEHIHDHRETRWLFHYPTSSGIDPRPLRVGQLASYMIEAILRRNAFFTYSARLIDESGSGVRDVAREIHALEEAASAYEAWYEACFDEATQSLSCPPDELPSVNWELNQDAWLRFLCSPRGEQCRAWFEIDCDLF
jgi:hypothetical protein